MDKNGHRVLRTGFRIDTGASVPVIVSNFVDRDFDDVPNYKVLTGEWLTRSRLHRR